MARLSLPHPDNGIKTANAEWSDCPGCPKCAPNNGLVLRRGSWRPTRAHSYVFLFAKTKNYFCDAEAVREPCESGIGGAAFGNVTNQDDALESDAQARRCTPADRERYIATGRNPRSVWKIGMPLFRLRDDLTPEQRAYVFRRMLDVDSPAS